jgi:hypothetical protein
MNDKLTPSTRPRITPRGTASYNTPVMPSEFYILGEGNSSAFHYEAPYRSPAEPKPHEPQPHLASSDEEERIVYGRRIKLRPPNEPETGRG